MTSGSRAQRRPVLLVFGLIWLLLALWTVADGDPFLWRGACQAGMGLYFVGDYVFAESDGYTNFSMAAIGLLFALAANGPWWLRVLGAVLLAVGLFLMGRALVRSQLSKRAGSRVPSAPT